MKTTIKYGILLALGSIALNVLIHFTVREDSSLGKALGLLGYAVYALAIVLGILEKRKSQNDTITYSNALGAGFMIMLVGAFITSLYIYVLYKFIDHSFITNKIHEAQKSFQEKNLDEQAAGVAMKITKAMIVPGGIAIISFIGMLISGLIISLIAAAFLKKENNFNANPGSQNSGFDPYR